MTTSTKIASSSASNSPRSRPSTSPSTTSETLRRWPRLSGCKRKTRASWFSRARPTSRPSGTRRCRPCSSPTRSNSQPDRLPGPTNSRPSTRRSHSPTPTLTRPQPATSSARPRSTASSLSTWPPAIATSSLCSSIMRRVSSLSQSKPSLPRQRTRSEACLERGPTLAPTPSNSSFPAEPNCYIPRSTLEKGREAGRPQLGSLEPLELKLLFQTSLSE
mmetsp:Transcript_19180/g.32677  ORF Transcript_19180/g.32677 Transcript_19180/m.32677 type:complete len:218 (+) Transcript_19180:1313-1966(+)